MTDDTQQQPSGKAPDSAATVKKAGTTKPQLKKPPGGNPVETPAGRVETPVETSKGAPAAPAKKSILDECLSVFGLD
jgi:hypothetical protein